jgi:lactate permease
VLLMGILVFFRLPLYKSAPLVLLYTAALVCFVWGASAPIVFASIFKGFLLAFEIGLIVFGAIFFLELLKAQGFLKSLEQKLSQISPDHRIQAILIAWLFGSFIEGSAGFGTPAAVVAPLLVAMGFGTYKSVLLALFANSTAVTFGAIGTPIRIGFLGLDISEVPAIAGTLQLGAGMCVPFVLTILVVGFRETLRSKKLFIQFIPWMLFSALVYLVPFYLVAQFSYEFPSLMAPVFALVILSATTKYGFLVPKSVFKVPQSDLAKSEGTSLENQSWIQAMAPYLLLLLFLILGRMLFLPIGKNIFLTSEIAHKLQLYNPGLIFIITAIVVVCFAKKKKLNLIRQSFKQAVLALIKPVIAIFSISAFVQLMIHSSLNQSDRLGMLTVVARAFSEFDLNIVAPFIGAFGSFLSGSATVSNLLFGKLQHEIAVSQNFNTQLALALQLVGAAIGNMLALSNVLAVEATVSGENMTAKILRSLALPCLFYLLLCVAVGFSL